jgi:aerobic carbon-monoxide dehydrogenase medium subunit
MSSLLPFDYFEPTSVKEAAGLLTKHVGKAKVLAGGIDLIPSMRRGRILAEYLVNIQNIPGLAAIEVSGDGAVSFGAMTRLRDLEVSQIVQKTYPALYQAIHQISSVQTKFMGTAVGNICVATPASDVATALFALGAELVVAGEDGERKESMETFCVDYCSNCLGAGEIVTRVILPKPPAGSGTAFMNLIRTHGDIAKVSVAVAVTLADGICRDVKIAVGSAAPTVFRAKQAETVFMDAKVSPDAIESAAEAAAGETQPITDQRSTADYRKEMTRVLVKRALEKAVNRSKA